MQNHVKKTPLVPRPVAAACALALGAPLALAVQPAAAQDEECGEGRQRQSGHSGGSVL